MKYKSLKVFTILSLTASMLAGCSSGGNTSEQASTNVSKDETMTSIEEALNLENNEEVTWTYNEQSDAWIMSSVSAVTNPELEDYQGVSVAVPGTYITGIDTDDNGSADITADTYTKPVNGDLVIDEESSITSSNGQVYTASTAPVVFTTGAAGYSAQKNQTASTNYTSEGFVQMSSGNRGKQSTVTDEDGNESYTGDAPDCLVDQKNAIRYVKYNILLGNLPGNVDYFVTTGGSGGGAHAAMVAATGNNEVYYDYEIEAGAVGVYKAEDGSYITTVTIDGEEIELSDGVWGTVAYSAITSLSEAGMALAFEYYMDTDYNFNSDFQKEVAKYLSESYMEYINGQNLSVNEADVDLDINGDGDKTDTIELSIEYDEKKYADTNGYGGTYLDFYLAEFKQNLQWYLDNLDYADGWTWFDKDGNALSDDQVASMTSEDKAQTFIEGRYAKASNNGMGGPGGGMPGGQRPDGNMPGGGRPEGMPDGELPEGEMPAGEMPGNGAKEEVGTPDAGTTQSASSSTDSKNYSSYEEMLAAYQEDIASIEAGDEYGNNIVELYDPIKWIGEETTDNPTWARVVMGASEGDISMFNSLNMQIAWLNAGTDATIEWQWDGGHVPSEVLGESLSLTIDSMYGKYVDGAVAVEKAEAEVVTENGSAESATGTDLSDWVDASDITNISFSLSDAVSYRTKGAAKSTPAFDVIDYGKEDYEFGSSEKDARHWDKYVLEVFEKNEEALSKLFNQ